MEKLDFPNYPENFENVQNNYESVLERAKLYRKFGRVACAITNYENAIKNSPEREKQDGEEFQAEALIKQIESALGSLDKSLKNQIDFSIIDHKQINTKEALEEELQSGTSIPELDIRFDKDGKPWISHSPRAGTRFLFSKPIHTLHSEEVAEIGERLSLEEGLELFSQYRQDNDNHRVVLELKELGPSLEKRGGYLENVKKLLDQYGLAEDTIFATLSPSILRSIHKVFPENSKILNGGIAPIISYGIAEKTLGLESNQEIPVKIPGVELFLSNATEITDRDDGYGKQTGYLWARLPKETVETLRKLNETGGFGAASLTVVNKFASVLDMFNPKAAEKLRRAYAKKLDKLGLKKQVAIPKNNPIAGLNKIRGQVGNDSIIYSNISPGDFAADLPSKEDPT